MELKLMVSSLEHMEKESWYNHNYYKLPIFINHCDILFGESDDDYTTLWQLGRFVEDKFERECWLGESSIYDSSVSEYINLLDANKNMIWT